MNPAEKNSPGPGISRVPGPGRMEGGGGGGWDRKCLQAAYNSKTIHGIEMKFGRVVGNHKLIDSV